MSAYRWECTEYVQGCSGISEKWWRCCGCNTGYDSFLLWKSEKSETEQIFQDMDDPNSDQ